jgi:hypothetical protein
MLVGEPGIGNTALCEQPVNLVEARGGLPLVGHCYPEGSAGVPYQPSKSSRASHANATLTHSLLAKRFAKKQRMQQASPHHTRVQVRFQRVVDRRVCVSLGSTRDATLLPVARRMRDL